MESQRFNKRLDTLKMVVDFKKKDPENHQDLSVWKSFLALIKSLGKEGMSSDESDVDPNTGETTYIVKKLDWRVDVDQQMDAIDRQRDKQRAARVKRGSRPIKRKRLNNGPSSKRLPPKGMKRALVDPGWLENCMEADDLRLSSKPFNLALLNSGKGKGKSRAT